MTSLRVLAALSGGVDSATAAARAVDAGHDVTAVHLALSANPSSYRTGARGCCTLEDARDARRAADVIGIPFYVWDMAERFHPDVVEDFVAEYAAGRTPNPCVRCNEKIKFAAVLDRALALGFDAVCTGHHARLENGLLRRSVDHGKDQSYVLAVLTRDQLAHAMFPLGDTTKDQVRIEAAHRGLGVADKPDSHDVCFIADGDTRGFLTSQLGEAPGPIVDSSGATRRHATTAPTPSPSASAAACAWTTPPPTAAPATSSASSPSPARSPSARPRSWKSATSPPSARSGPAATRSPSPATARSSSARTASVYPCAAPLDGEALPHHPDRTRQGSGHRPDRRPLRRRHRPSQRHHHRHPSRGQRLT